MTSDPILFPLFPWLKCCLHALTLLNFILFAWFLGLDIGTLRRKLGHKSGVGIGVRVLAALLTIAGYYTAFPTLISGEGVDPSWQYVLEHATAEKWIYGKDIVFTYGPLGPLGWDTMIGEGRLLLDRPVIAFWQATLIGLLAYRITSDCRPAMAVVVGVWLFATPGDSVTYLVITMLAWAMQPSESEPSPGRILRMIVIPASFAVLATAKFTYMVAGGAAIGFWVVYTIWKNRSAVALMPPLVFIGVFCAIWTSVGQPLNAVPAWMTSCLKVSSAYAEAMQVVIATSSTIILAWIMLGCCILAVVWALWGPRFRLNLKLSGIILLFLGLLAITWKHSILRADGHILMLHNVGPLIAFLALTRKMPLLGGDRPSAFITGILIAGLMILSLTGRASTLGIPMTSSVLTYWNTAKQRLAWIANGFPEAQTSVVYSTNKPDDHLPTITEMLQDAPVDVFNYSQSLAFLNNWNYQPRPVFQSYQACSPPLAELNRDHWLSRQRELSLVCRVHGIDQRLPTTEDALCWPLWLTAFEPKVVENDVVLLQPVIDPPSPPQWQEVASGSGKLNEAIPAPASNVDTLLRLRFKLKATSWGRLVNAAYQPAVVFAATTMTDNTVHLGRVIPDMGESGLVLRPYLESTVDLVAYYAKDAGFQMTPKSVTFSIENERDTEVLHEIPYSWETARAHRPRDDEALSGFRSQLAVAKHGNPDRIPSVLGSVPGELARWNIAKMVTVEMDGRSTLRVDAPSVMVFRVDPKGGTLEGKFLVPSSSWKRKTPSDGVNFLLATATHDGLTSIIFNRYLDPGKNESEREWQTFRVTLPPIGPPWLIVKTETGPTAYQDRAIWADFRWTPNN